jgi:homopolymeric O-antigen transport system ATP-binding protein
MRNDVLIRVEGISKKFCRNLKRSLWYGLQDTVSDVLGRDSQARELRREEFWAVDDVTFEVHRGECLGLIGRNGAGKTTILKMLNGLIKPDRGRIEIRGRVGALIALGAGFSPILTGRENIYVNGSVLGLSRKEINHRLDAIVDFAEIGDFLDAPVQSYSSGMQVRLGFAVATAMEPDILLVDEVLAVGDFRFRWKCFQRIKTLIERQVCVILVSHNSQDLFRTCSTGLVMEQGRNSFFGAIDEAVLTYESTPGNSAHAANVQDIRPEFSIQLTRIDFVVDGVTAITMKSGQMLAIDINMNSQIEIDQARIVLELYHSEFGALFSISSYADNGWIEIPKGESIVRVNLDRLPLQFGSYYVELSIRGPSLDDIYGHGKGQRSLTVTEPAPDYEGFGVKGVILPNCSWQVKQRSYSNAFGA